jgi:hypothetical protein
MQVFFLIVRIVIVLVVFIVIIVRVFAAEIEAREARRTAGRRCIKVFQKNVVRLRDFLKLCGGPLAICRGVFIRMRTKGDL